MNNSISQIQQYLSSFQLDKALQLTKKEFDKNPEDLLINKFLSHIFGLKEDYYKAIQIIEKIILKYPNDFDLNNNLGHYFMKYEDTEKASFYINEAKKINAQSPAPYQNLAELMILNRKFDDALFEINTSIKIFQNMNIKFSNYIYAIILKTEILIALKQQQKAADLLINYLEIEFNGELALQLVQIDKKSINNSYLEIALSELKKTHYPSALIKYETKTPLFFFLANYYQNSKDENAEENFIKGNNEIFSIQRYTPMADQKRYLGFMSNYKKITEIELKSNVGSGNIFIMGMPRSGTTLVESIISSNNSTFPGGELNSIGQAYDQYIDQKEKISNEDLQNFGQFYIYKTNMLKKSFKFITDKMPSNFRYLGFILKVMPHAKTLILLRDPWKTAISLFKQRYVTHIPYSSSFFNIGIEISNFEALISFWKNKCSDFSEKVKFIRYEDLLLDPMSEQKRIYEFCKINDDYIPKKREEFFGRTASMYNVRSEITQRDSKFQYFQSFQPDFIDGYQSQKDYWAQKGLKIEQNFYIH